MSIWNRVRSALPGWPSTARKNSPPRSELADQHLLAANENLRALLEDSSIPASVRAELGVEFEAIEQISRKLMDEEIHIAAFGRVGVGKSALLNALLEKPLFSTSPLHGETRDEARADWNLVRDGQVVLVDTPGIDELDGRSREQLAYRVCQRADVVLMVCDGDLTEVEFQALQPLASSKRPLLLVLNKSDRYSAVELDLLLARLRERVREHLAPSAVIAASADPRPRTVIRHLADGSEREESQARRPDVGALRQLLWQLLERDGKSLAALNAALFASSLDTEVAARIVAARKSVAERLIRSYCLAKAFLVAANPVPVADLLAAAGTDVALVMHLGEVYGFRLSRREASRLLLTISAQWAALMGAYWGLNLVSAALKTASVGLSTALTATAQGALAWYATYLTGQMAQSWFAKGKSWGDSGPREVARMIQASLDRDSLIRTARDELLGRLDPGQ